MSLVGDAGGEPDVRKPGAATTTASSWRWTAGGPGFDPDDFELLELVLCVAPDLRAVATLGKLARQRDTRYPLTSADEVAAIMGDDRLEVGDFVITSGDVLKSLGPEFFPLAHEGELLSAVHLALQRCRAETVARWTEAVVARLPE